MAILRSVLLLWGGVLMFGVIYQHNRCMMLSHKLKEGMSRVQEKHSSIQKLWCQISHWYDSSITNSIAQNQGFRPLAFEQCRFVKIAPEVLT